MSTDIVDEEVRGTSQEEGLNPGVTTYQYNDSQNFSGALIQGDVNVLKNYDDKFEVLLAKDKQPEPLWCGYAPDLSSLCSVLRTENVLIIGGDIDCKNRIAEECALQLSELLFQDSRVPEVESGSSDDGRYPVYRWQGGEVNIKMFDCLASKPNNLIAVVNDVRSHEVSRSYKEFLRRLGNNRYLIITTEEALETWSSFSSGADGICRSPTYRELFSRADRQEYLRKNISLEKEKNRYSVKNIAIQDKEFSDCCEALGSFEKIADLVAEVGALSCKAKDSVVDHSKLHKIKENLNDDSTQVRVWFDDLSSRSQQLALLLSLFKGVKTEQLFEIADRIVRGVWKDRVDSVVLFDHHDLYPLLKYFRIVNDETPGECVKPKKYSTPEQVFSLCWRGHRRFMVSLIPEVINLTEESLRNQSWRKREMYGSQYYRGVLRDNISEFFAFLGCIHIDLLEDHLLHLVKVESYDARIVVGRSLAGVYAKGGAGNVVDLLQSWSKNSKTESKLRYLMSANDTNSSSSPKLALQLTVVASISEISRYESPNELSSGYLGVFEEILKSAINQTVLDRIGERLLPTLFFRHFILMASYFEYLVCHCAFDNEFVSNALAYAYDNYPTEVSALLQFHFDESANAKDGDKNKLTKRLKMLSTAVRCIGLINDSSESGNFTVEKSFNVIHSILKKEHHSHVRQSALLSMVELACRDFLSIDETFQGLVASLTAKERNVVVAHITNIYIAQRRGREDGEVNLLINENRCDVWLNSKRPKMPIEESMAVWLESVTSDSAAQLAYLAESSIVENFERAELEAIEDYRLRLSAEFEGSSDAKIIDSIILDKPNFDLSRYSKYLSIPIGIPFSDKSEKATIKAILPVVLNQDEREQRRMIERFNKDGRTNLSRSLESVLFLERSKYFVGLGVVIIASCVVFFLT